MAQQGPGSVILLSTGNSLRVKEPIDEVRKRIGLARTEGPLGMLELSEIGPEPTLVLVGHVVTVRAS